MSIVNTASETKTPYCQCHDSQYDHVIAKYGLEEQENARKIAVGLRPPVNAEGFHVGISLSEPAPCCGHNPYLNGCLECEDY